MPNGATSKQTRLAPSRIELGQVIRNRQPTFPKFKRSWAQTRASTDRRPTQTAAAKTLPKKWHQGSPGTGLPISHLEQQMAVWGKRQATRHSSDGFSLVDFELNVEDYELLLEFRFKLKIKKIKI